MNLISIEYPGYIKNQEAALITLGGIKSIECVIYSHNYLLFKSLLLPQIRNFL